MPVWRKSLHRRFGWFDGENYDPHADWELWLRAAEQGAKFGFLSVPLGLYLDDVTSHNHRSKSALKVSKAIVERYYQSTRKTRSAWSLAGFVPRLEAFEPTPERP